MIFEEQGTGGKISAEEASIVLDVVVNHGIAEPKQMYGTGRKSAVISRARTEAWSRLVASGYTMARAARIFGVTRAAVSISMKRNAMSLRDAAETCPSCGKPYGDRWFQQEE